jgi:hypothetical protein
MYHSPPRFTKPGMKVFILVLLLKCVISSPSFWGERSGIVRKQESGMHSEGKCVALSNHDDPLDSPETEGRIGPPLKKGDKKPSLEKRGVRVIGM